MFGYDINLFLEQLGNDPRINRFAALPKSTQKLRFLKFQSFVMKDLLFHLNGSLAELTEALAKSNHAYPILKQSALVKDDDGVFSPGRMTLHRSSSVVFAKPIMQRPRDTRRLFSKAWQCTW